MIAPRQEKSEVLLKPGGISDPGETIGLHARCVITCFSGWRRSGAYAADETSIRYPKTIYRSRAETEKDFYVGSRRDMLHRFDGDRKIARRRMLPDRAVLTANNPQCLLLNFAFGRGSNDRH